MSEIRVLTAEETDEVIAKACNLANVIQGLFSDRDINEVVLATILVMHEVRTRYSDVYKLHEGTVDDLIQAGIIRSTRQTATNEQH